MDEALERMEMAEVKRGEVGQDWGLGDLWTEQMEV